MCPAWCDSNVGAARSPRRFAVGATGALAPRAAERGGLRFAIASSRRRRRRSSSSSSSPRCSHALSRVSSPPPAAAAGAHVAAAVGGATRGRPTPL
eukprot:974741-Prymnesium_polylepis.1